MKRRVGQKFRRMLTVAMSAIMIVEAVNCASLTAMASDGSSVSAGDAITHNDELASDVNEAESAAIAADEAAEAAEEALKAAEDLSVSAGDAALEIKSDGTFTQTVSDGNGGTKEEPILNTDIDNAITDAEKKVDIANNTNDSLIKQTEADVDAIKSQLATDTQAKLSEAATAAATAEDEAQKAKDQLARAQAAKDYFTAKAAADNAQKAADNAQKAADDAKLAWDNAKAIFDKANADIDEAIAKCNFSVTSGDAGVQAQAAIDKAQEAINEAKKTVDEAAAKFEEAMKDLEAAKEAARLAAEKAESYSDKVVDRWSDADATISEATANKAEIDLVIYVKEGKKQYDDDKVTAEKHVGDEKQTIFGFAVDWYTEKDIKDAIERKNKYEDALKVYEKSQYKNMELNDLYIKSANELDTIILAGNGEKLADSSDNLNQAVNQATEQTLEKFVYNDTNTTIDYLDKEKQQMYQNLLKEIEDSNDDFVFCNNKLTEYEELCNSSNLREAIKDFFGKMEFEYKNKKYSGFDFDEFTFVVNPKGLSLGFWNTENNKVILTSIKDGALYITEVDELEFATYSATFDKVAAAQSAQKAADAVQKAAQAKLELDAAKEALKNAQERLNAAKLNKMDIDAAKEALQTAQLNVDKTKLEYDRAQEAADEAKKAADDAKVIPTEKQLPVKVAYYVLNRGLSQPSEVKSYPKDKYSKKVATGELYAGENYSNIPIYKAGVKDEALVKQYIKTAPSDADLKNAGILKDGESIKWYVIKTEGDGYHIDGFIENQKFNITVLYGYKDGDGKFVEFTKADGTTYAESGVFGLNESYSFIPPKMEFYSLGEDVVSGTVTADDTIEVIYTKDATKTVIVNYYRESLSGALLGSTNRNVSVKNAATYDEVIKASMLNRFRPGDCNNGVLINYTAVGDTYVANIVYSPIPTIIPGTPDEPTTPPTEPTTPPTTIDVPEEQVPLIPVNTPVVTPIRVNTVTPVTPVVDDVEEPVNVEDEETPLANVAGDSNDDDATPTDGALVEIEDEETPLAANGSGCWIHWLILLITAVYTFYELVRCIKRNKQIRELSDAKKSAEA